MQNHLTPAQSAGLCWVKVKTRIRIVLVRASPRSRKLCVPVGSRKYPSLMLAATTCDSWQLQFVTAYKLLSDCTAPGRCRKLGVCYRLCNQWSPLLFLFHCLQSLRMPTRAPEVWWCLNGASLNTQPVQISRYFPPLGPARPGPGLVVALHSAAACGSMILAVVDSCPGKGPFPGPGMTPYWCRI